VAGGRALTLVQRGDDELAIALDVASGKELWAQGLGPAYTNQYGNGPRSTPTVEGNRVFVQSVTGPLVCLEAESGKVVWQHHLLQEFGAKPITWGLSASPLIVGDLVIGLPGAKGAAVVAFHKGDGTVAWKSGDDPAAYASPVLVTVEGQPQLVCFTALGLVGLEPTTGKQKWRMPWKTEFDCNICTPLVEGDRIFVSSGEKVGCALLKVNKDTPPTVVWESKGPKSSLKNYWANSVLHDGHLYGLSGEFEGVVDLVCVELATGKRVWAKDRFGLASVTLADAHLYLTDRTGNLVVAEATPKGYQEKGRSPLLTQVKYATSPTIANGRLYARDLKEIVCVDLKKE
jgi:outer membrane protein assembly factor BamB